MNPEVMYATNEFNFIVTKTISFCLGLNLDSSGTFMQSSSGNTPNERNRDLRLLGIPNLEVHQTVQENNQDAVIKMEDIPQP